MDGPCPKRSIANDKLAIESNELAIGRQYWHRFKHGRYLLLLLLLLLPFGRAEHRLWLSCRAESYGGLKSNFESDSTPACLYIGLI